MNAYPEVYSNPDLCSQGAARGLLRLARASARPLLVAIVVNRALETLDVACDPVVRAARQTPAQQ
eukprot:121182-Chlamydomonas_euryale.AAC.3